MNLAARLFLFAEKAAGKIPVRLMRSVARAGGYVYYALSRSKRLLVMRNMRRALGPGATDAEVRRTARLAYRHYADYWVDFFWIPTLSRRYILDNFARIGEAELMKVVEAPEGAIVVLPHFGSWEAGAVYLSSLGPFSAVAEILKPPEVFEMFVRVRESIGIKIFPYDKSPETRERMVEALEGGIMLALLCDRDLKGTGVEVEFFGERTTLPPGPATLAVRSGCPVICVNVRNLPDGTWVGHATEPIYVDAQGGDDVIQKTMQEIAYRLEELIREDPPQWHMFMPGWPSDRE